MAGRTAKMVVTRWAYRTTRASPDELIVEEPLEIRLDGALVATTMRTPGHDFELAAGLCHGDGLLAGAAIRRITYCGDDASAVERGFNSVDVDSGGGAPPPPTRLSTTMSSCGLCGTAAIDQLLDRLQPLPAPATSADLDLLATAPGHMVEAQSLFARTGAVHAAAAFGPDGRPTVVREDVGRHNAVDKVVGRLLLDNRLPAEGLGLCVSGRASFEIVQKAWAAGFAAVVAVSAPTALAVETARAAGITLAGFVRDDRLTLYAPAP